MRIYNIAANRIFYYKTVHSLTDCKHIDIQTFILIKFTAARHTAKLNHLLMEIKSVAVRLMPYRYFHKHHLIKPGHVAFVISSYENVRTECKEFDHI